MSVAQFSITVLTNSLEASHKFYVEIVGCTELERSDNFIRYSFYNHELTVCFMGEQFSPQ